LDVSKAELADADRADADRADADRADADRAGARELLRLAVPALLVLAAEPLYLLVDTAVVGHLGAVPLAGLAIGAVLLAQVSSQLNFLSYGTTARAARLHGAGRRAEAVGEGVQSTDR
jgi:Na+-driven multidrug efflux pump